MLLGYFALKTNRELFIKKIDDRERLQNKYEISLNEEVDKRHREILLNWKNKTTKEKLNFCEEVLNAPNDNSIKVVADKKVQIDTIMQNSKDNVKDKLKKIINEIGK